MSTHFVVILMLLLGAGTISQTPLPSTVPSSVVSVTPVVTVGAGSQGQVKNDAGVETWQYPGAEVVEKSDTSLHLRSSDSASRITEWYKNRLSQLKLSINTQISTNTNGHISNKLVSSSREEQVQVAVTSQADGKNLIQINVGL